MPSKRSKKTDAKKKGPRADPAPSKPAPVAKPLRIVNLGKHEVYGKAMSRVGGRAKKPRVEDLGTHGVAEDEAD